VSELNFLDTGGNKQHITTPDINTLAFKTNMTERVRIGATGSVGIGTASPDATGGVTGAGLHVHGPENDNVRIRLTTPSKSNPGSLIGYYGLNRLGIDCYDGLEVRDVTASYATRFKIDENGYVTQPNRPAFSTFAQTSGFSANSPNDLTPSARINNGNYYNASNGRFTAPCDGTYFFFFSYVGDNGVAAPVMYFAVNGSDSGPGSSCYYTAYQGSYHGQLYTLSENDYVNARARDWNGATPDPWNTYWGGWLLY